MERKKC